jgi:hypothetical protein
MRNGFEIVIIFVYDLIKLHSVYFIIIIIIFFFFLENKRYAGAYINQSVTIRNRKGGHNPVIVLGIPSLEILGGYAGFLMEAEKSSGTTISGITFDCQYANSESGFPGNGIEAIGKFFSRF